MSNSGNASVPNSQKIASVNLKAKQIVTEINELVDESFKVKEARKTLAHLDEVKSRYQKQISSNESRMKELREAYVARNAKYRGNRKRAEDDVTKLYHMLAKKYTVRGEKVDSSAIARWNIPEPFLSPTCTDIDLPSPRTELAVNISRKLFQVKAHFHSRSRFTLSGAQKNLSALENVLIAEKHAHQERQRVLSDLNLKIENAKDEIEELKKTLADPPHYIWEDAAAAHTAYVRELLIYIDAKVKRQEKVRVNKHSSHNNGNSDFNDAETRSVPISFRRVSGPDINTEPGVVTRSEMGAPISWSDDEMEVQEYGDRLFGSLTSFGRANSWMNRSYDLSARYKCSGYNSLIGAQDRRVPYRSAGTCGHEDSAQYILSGVAEPQLATQFLPKQDRPSTHQRQHSSVREALKPRTSMNTMVLSKVQKEHLCEAKNSKDYMRDLENTLMNK